MATTNELIVQAIGRAILFRELTTAEVTYWSEEINQGFTTPVLIASAGAQLPIFLNENLPIATMYYALFGTFATIDEMIFWRSIIDSGGTVQDIGAAFADSDQFYARYPSATVSNSAKLDTIIVATEVSGISTELKEWALNSITEGRIGWGDVVNYLVSLSEYQEDSELALIYNALTDSVPQLSDIALLGNNVNDALSQLFITYEALIPLSTTSGDDIYTGTDEADTIRGMGGNDTLSGGEGSDTFIFEATSALNGVDTLSDFTIGVDGDILDFSAFLNLPNSANITTVYSTATTETAWANGEILVVAGNALTSAEAVAALFGTLKAFAAPIGSAKAVVITADIIGNASVWYLVNQTQTDAISATEISLGITLSGINNLELVGFDATNFI